MVRKIAAVIVCIVLTVLCCGCSKRAVNSSGFMFDTAVVITVYSDNDKSAADNTLKYCAEFENVFSVTLDGAQAFMLNRSTSFTQTSEHIINCINKANYYSNLSNGTFDITIRPLSSIWNYKQATVPSAEQVKAAIEKIDYKKIEISGDKVNLNSTTLDFGAIAKGYIADMATEHLKGQGVKQALINLGGNIVAFGKEYDIGVKMPFSEEIAAVLKVKDKAVSTSGTYERYFEKEGKKYHHIIDAKTGYPVDSGIDSATVICEKSVDADVLSTVCVLLGHEKAIKLINDIDGTEVMLIDTEGNIHTTNGIKHIKDKIYTIE